MANFEAYQEYQRIEDFEEDSPPGEEDLLVHVPEGLRGINYIYTLGMFLLGYCYAYAVDIQENTDLPIKHLPGKLLFH